jgi:hypothetical protein
MRPQEIADALEKKAGNIRYLLSQMTKDGQVKSNGDGTYTTANTTNSTNSKGAVSGVSGVSGSKDRVLNTEGLGEMDDGWTNDFLTKN